MQPEKQTTLRWVFRLRRAEAARASGKLVSINQNMRFDQSMRGLRQILAAARPASR